MINENQPSSSSTPAPAILFGVRLQSAREALSFERKDVAAQLRLNEKVITMMENNNYPSDLPPTFIRGYLRSYAKLLQIPEPEVLQSIEAIQPKLTVPASISTPITALNDKAAAPLLNSNYFMHIFTGIIVVTLIGLVSAWWHTHSTRPASSLIEASNTGPQIIPIVANTSPETPATPLNLATAPIAQPTTVPPTASTSPALAENTTPTPPPVLASNAKTENNIDTDTDDDNDTVDDTNNDAVD